jgi:hypothetical protein
MVKGMRFLIPVLIIARSVISCSAPQQKPEVAFYYWRTEFAPDSSGHRVLAQHQPGRVYLRYFDLVYDDAAAQAIPLSPVHTRQRITHPLIPVVFIRNKVFERTDSLLLDALADRLLRLVGTINRSMSVQPQEFQVDCDWTSGTSKKYFHFLRLVKEKLLQSHGDYAFTQGALLSATIRLHQVKYPGRQGVPPVDKGVLMFYNMGKIEAAAPNSIYHEETALQYIRALKKYPLDLDFALPVFSWGIHIRDGQVVTLLNKMDSRNFGNKEEFTSAGASRYKAVKSFFKNGFYFKAGDEVRVEEVSSADLQKMAAILKKYYDRPVHRIIFYDLDSINISRYEKNIFKKVSGCF